MSVGRDLRRTVRWGIKSAAGLVANLALLTVWVDGLGLAAWWAVGINWLLISLVGYVVTDGWVYQETPSPSGLVANARRYVGMQGVMGVAKLANWGIYLLLLPVVDYRVAWAVGAIVTFLATFAGTRALWSNIPERI